MSWLGRAVGSLAILAITLAVIAALLILTLMSVYRATCGSSDNARPQYIFVLPGQEVPSDCRRARSGYRILVDELGLRGGTSE
jgi:hypothetical protein